MEEKERGLTIDLGFAWARLGDESVGFVDVPGHERFIKNMLAGVGAVDVALFVVAGDEGWMPQSEEHLAVLDLLDVHHGVIAITRTDTVEADVVELAELEVVDQIAGTSLEGWPIVLTAAPTGAGIDEVRTALTGALAAAGPPADHGRPRLWIDRAFTISGAGTVVTGTLVDGVLSRVDELRLWPPDATVRIRGMQSHETELETVAPGTRTALNLAGPERAQILRGAMLGRESDFRTTTTFLADLRTVRTLADTLTDRGAYHLHIGSGSWPVRLRLVPQATDDIAAILRAPVPVPLTAGDRLILRDVGRRAVVAGGRVLDPHPRVLRKGAIADRLPRLRRVVAGNADERADALLEDRRIASIADLSRDTAGGRPADALTTEELAVSRSAAADHAVAIAEAVATYQRDNPLRSGAPKASIATSAGLDVAVAELIIRTTPGLVDDGATVRTAEYRPTWDGAQEQSWRSAQERLLESGLGVPRASQLGLDDEVLHSLLRDHKLVRIADDLVYLPSQLDELQRRLGSLDDGFTVADFRDSMEMTRRHAVPVLEWLDAQGWTSRRGDERSVRRQPSPEPGDALPR